MQEPADAAHSPRPAAPTPRAKRTSPTAKPAAGHDFAPRVEPVPRLAAPAAPKSPLAAGSTAAAASKPAAPASTPPTAAPSPRSQRGLKPQGPNPVEGPAAPKPPRPLARNASGPAGQRPRVEELSDYWFWCRSKFDMAKYETAAGHYKGLDPSLAKTARDRLLAELDVQLRASGRTVPPLALIYATREDMRALVASLSRGDPKTELERLGREGYTTESGDHYPGWAAGDRLPSAFWFIATHHGREAHTGPKGKMRPEVAALLADTRVPAFHHALVLKALSPTSNFLQLQPLKNWSRGASFSGHHVAMVREADAFAAAATLQREEVERLRTKIGDFAAEKPPPKRAKRAQAKLVVYTAKLTAMQALLQKATDEAEFYERQALATRRFTSPEGVAPDSAAAADASPPKAPSPVDSLDVALAESSLEDPLSQARAADDSGTPKARSRPSTVLDTAFLSPEDSQRTPAPAARSSPVAAPRPSTKSPGQRARPSRQASAKKAPHSTARPPGKPRAGK